MFSSILVTFLLGQLFNFAFAESVVDLVDDDFASRIAEYDTTLVMFYAPW